MLRTLFLSTIGLVSATRLVARDNTISQSSTNPAFGQSLGVAGSQTNILSGVSYWLSGGSTHNIFGNLNNNGQLTISQTDYLKQNPFGTGMTCDFIGTGTSNGNLVNSGSISINDYGSTSAPTYDWYLNAMSNTGSLQFCGRGDTGGSTYQLYCAQTCTNNGVIDFEQYYNNIGASFVWRNNYLAPPGATTVTNVYNNGAFRLVNVVYHNVQNVLGNGCWVIGSGAVLYLEDGSGYYQNPNFGPTFPNQQISFTDTKSGTLHMDTQVYSHNSNFGPQVYGFGSGNAIEFYEIISSFSYASGVLNVKMASGNAVNIKLGTGYVSSSFYKASNPSKYNIAGYNAIFYSGNAPVQSIPGTCQVSLGFCSDPSATVVSSSTTTTTTTTTTTSTTTPFTTTTTTATIPSTTSTTTSFTTTSSITTSSTTTPITTTLSITATPTTIPSTTTTRPSTVNPTTTPPIATSPTTNTISSTTTVATTTSSTSIPSGQCVSLGCYTDSVSDRTLQGAYNTSSSQTVELCQAFCTSRGYAFFGVEYNFECFCSNTLNGNAMPRPASECNYACTGDSTEKCGGDSRINLYQCGAGTGTTSTTPGSSSTSITGAGAGTTVSTTTTTAPSPTCTNDNTTYTASSGHQYLISCGVDYYGGDLSNQPASNLTACINACDTTPSCVAIAYTSNTCYLKNTLKTGVSNPSVTGAKCLNCPTTTPIASTCGCTAPITVTVTTVVTAPTITI